MAFTTVLGSASTDTTTIVGTSGADSTLIQNLDDNVFVGAQEEVDTVSFQNFKGLVSNYTVKGGAGNDNIGGGGTTSFNTSFFNGNAGNDVITLTNASSSTIQGGAGNDTTTVALLNTGLYNGNKGNDTFSTVGNVAAASVFGGQGTDQFTINGGLSTATVQGNIANDTVNIGAGAINASTINGNAGDDTLTVTGVLTDFTASTIFGGAGGDTISAVLSTSTSVGVTLSGDAGNDNLIGSSANDTILTGIGTDAVRGNAGNDSITASTGVDTINYSTAGVTMVDTVTGFTAGTDIFGASNAAFTVGAGETAVSISDADGISLGITAAGGLTITSSAVNVATDLATPNADILFLATAGSTFAAAMGNNDRTVAAVAAGEAMLTTWYDSDTNEAVVQLTSADAGGNDINNASTFLEVTRIAMAASDYTTANIDASFSLV